MSSGLHFIALIPPEEIREEVQHMKHYIRDTYNSSHSLNAPPHITMLSPFRLSEGKDEDLVHFVQKLAADLFPFRVKLKDFDVFKPRVLFVNVTGSEPLMKVQSRLEEMAREHPEIFNYNYHKRPFRPHLTLAFKDLSESDFHRAWQEFRDRSYNAEFEVTSLSLLRHDGSIWKEIKTIGLG